MTERFEQLIELWVEELDHVRGGNFAPVEHGYGKGGTRGDKKPAQPVEYTKPGTSSTDTPPSTNTSI